MSGISRRDFIKRTAASGVAGGALLYGLQKPAEAMSKDSKLKEQVGTLIDLSKCDGCTDLEIPRCVTSCREENKSRYPDPVAPEKIPYYWPNKKKEDWQDKKEIHDRLTPYNWLFIQRVSVEHGGEKVDVAIPRRCMHCENPPCANLCPFGAQAKTTEGVTLINKELCLGGAKCRDVCPWGIPSRQAGVGLYMKLAPKYLGAGVMYKCDLCYDRIKGGGIPACVQQCPRKAMAFGSMEEIKGQAISRAKEIGGYIYGDVQNGGTATFYISKVPFEKIHKQLTKQKSEQTKPDTPGFPLMPVDVKNFSDSTNGMFLGMLVAPIAGAAIAGYTAYKTMKGSE